MSCLGMVIMIAMWTVSAITAVATVFAPLAGNPPSSDTCSAHLAGGVMGTAWCGKKAPPKSYEKFRKAMASYEEGVSGVQHSIIQGFGDLQVVEAQCWDGWVDQLSVDIIVSKWQIVSPAPMKRANQGLSDMTRLVEDVFAKAPTKPAAVKIVLRELKSNLDESTTIMNDLATGADLFKSYACQAGGDRITKAAQDNVDEGKFQIRKFASLSQMLAGAQPPCKSAKVKAPYSDKALRKAGGSKSSKTTTAGDMSMDYPTSLDVGGKQVFLPVNLDSKAPSGYVTLEFTQGSKALAAMGGGTPAGQSGLRIKVLGKARPGRGKLRLTFSPAGGADVTKVVTVKLT